MFSGGIEKQHWVVELNSVYKLKTVAAVSLEKTMSDATGCNDWLVHDQILEFVYYTFPLWGQNWKTFLVAISAGLLV